MKLICTYELNGITKVVEVSETDELFKLRQGFWIDSSGNFCESFEAEKFIMPHMIKEIRKEKS